MVRGGAAAILAALLGCGSDSVAPTPTTDVSHFYWSLTLGQHAINLSTVAPYDTVRIAATPRKADGTPLTDAATYTERFRRVNYGRMEIDVTVDDPKAYTPAWRRRPTARPTRRACA